MHPTECPTREELAGYLLGKLQEEQLNALADHVDGCSSCQRNLFALEGVHDSLAPLLLGEPVSLPAQNAELQELLLLAKSLKLKAPAGENPGPQPTLPGAQAPAVPELLGQYRLLEKIGQGGMGAVYKALHLRLEKVLALKVLLTGQAHNPEDVARFEREMRVVGKLNHPNIVRATDAGESAGVPYLVMEFVEGTDLHKLVQRLGPLPLADACELVRQSAVGLHHAHEQGLVHRDVKPSNLLLCTEGQVKVLDLGLARTQSLQPAGDELTASGQTMGTLDYLAPEQALDARSVDVRADLYSLGCTLYHLLAGWPPFSGPKYQSPAQKLAAHLNIAPPSIQTQRPDVPDSLAALIVQLLDKEPNRRPATARGVAEALVPLTAGCDLIGLLARSAPSPEIPPPKGEPMLLDTKSSQSRANTRSLDRLLAPPPPLRPRRPRSLVVPLVGTVFVLTALVAAGFWLQSAGKNPSRKGGAPDEQASQEKQQGKGETGQPSAREEKEKKPVEEKKPAEEKKEQPPEPPEPPAKLAEHGTELLKKYCYRCHGVDFKVPRFNVLDRSILVAKRGKDEMPYVTPGKPEESYIWQRVGVDEDMPPGSKKPSDAEKALLKKWIAAGALFPGRTPRPFRSEKDILTSIRSHLEKTPVNDRKFQRYFSLAHLSNNHYHVSADELHLYRAGLAKAINSLSWKQAIVVPRAIDAEESLFNIDLRHLGWDKQQLWKEMVKVYPYGLEHSHDADQALRDLAGELVGLVGGADLLLLRADWFIATATRPPLYHTLLQLPQDARELERRLKVDVLKDFDSNELARAGFLTSGVSRQNRLVDRHDTDWGAYWKSYDFKSNEGAGDLLKLPLGPLFDEHPYPKQAFTHDGGEIIFNLPNGLQGYLLVNGKDGRIDEGPIEVVRDAQETAGTPLVVNGLSCMGCHKHGMIRFEDKVRDGSKVAGDALIKVQALFRKQEEMNKLLDRDEGRFLRALEEAAGPFLQTGPDKDKKIREFPEPVGAIARLYVKDLDLEDVALELGIEDPNKLKTLIESNPMLRKLGLGPLLNGGAIKRDVWSSLKFTTSPFQNVAKELGLGTPLVPF